MRKQIIFSIAFIFAIQTTEVFSKVDNGQTRRAQKSYNQYEFNRAASLYKRLNIKYPEDQDICVQLGNCYRKMNDYLQAQSWYDKANKMGTSSNSEFYLSYGLVLKNNERYDDAKIAFSKYMELMPGNPKGEMYLKSCDVVTQWKKFDLPLKVINVNALNSKASDFSPIFYQNSIVFTSSKKNKATNNIYGWTGGYFLNIYSAEKSDSGFLNFKKPKLLPENIINTRFHEGPASFSDDQTIYFGRVQDDAKIKKAGDVNRIKIFYSKMEEGKWKKIVSFYLNSDDYSVGQPYITPDAKKLYFVSDMPGTLGETDIYVCEWEINHWGAPKNLGPQINTSAKEMFPYLDNDGNLFFSSEGYAGYGGMDICVARNDGNNGFMQGHPMKAPINSAGDDFGIVLSKDGKSGYFSSNRYGGVGEDDIYYFNLSDVSEMSNLVASLYTFSESILIKQSGKYEVIIKKDTLLIRDTIRIIQPAEKKSEEAISPDGDLLAKNIEKPKPSKPSSVVTTIYGEGNFFAVQVASFNGDERGNKESFVSSLNDLGVLTKVEDGSSTKYLIGKLESMKKALELREAVISRGFSDAFVVKVENNKRVILK